MQSLILTDEQLRQLVQAGCRATLVDRNGKVVGVTRPLPFSPEEIADAQRRLLEDEPEFSVGEKNSQIAEHLKQVQEADHAL